MQFVDKNARINDINGTLKAGRKVRIFESMEDAMMAAKGKLREMQAEAKTFIGWELIKGDDAEVESSTVDGGYTTYTIQQKFAIDFDAEFFATSTVTVSVEMVQPLAPKSYAARRS